MFNHIVITGISGKNDFSLVMYAGLFQLFSPLQHERSHLKMQSTTNAQSAWPIFFFFSSSITCRYEMSQYRTKDLLLLLFHCDFKNKICMD